VFLEKKSQVKLTKNRLFFNNKNELIRIVSTNKKLNAVHVFNYSSYIMEYDTAAYYLTPAFRIGEVSKILGRKPDTIRKYEQKGLIPAASKVALNKDNTAQIRVYTLRDVYDLIELFSMRNASGRRRGHSGVDATESLKLVNARFQKIKNIGG
jgi:hypothetical protein